MGLTYYEYAKMDEKYFIEKAMAGQDIVCSDKRESFVSECDIKQTSDMEPCDE